ncbi:MAG: stage III sporulation AC/AD family protein [Oscillospiraceae bacterium]|nr:stage III sporulation AC/AD family protein [Oscillospiraceae bacterium]
MLVKCTAVGLFSSLTALLLKRYHPEISFLLSAAAVAVMLLAFSGIFDSLRRELEQLHGLMGDSAGLLGPMVKCLGISLVTKLGAGLCRDASQGTLAAVTELIGVAAALLVAMPTVLTMLQTIGGML